MSIDQPTYILAENYNEFRRLVTVLSVPLCYCDWVSSEQDVRGKRLRYAFATENWITNPNYDFDFIDRLKAACPVIFVEGDVP